MLRIALRTLLSIFLLSTFFPIAAQDTLSLEQSFQELMRRSQTYNLYKAVQTERLNSFWEAVSDSVLTQQQTIGQLRTELESIRKAAANYQQQGTAAEQQVAELQNQVDSISFLGTSLSKSGYHLFVWVIIATLIVMLALLLWRYKDSHQLAARAKHDLEKVTAEFEEHREKSRSKQVKLKRELQTAVNELEARKRGEV